MDFPRTLGWDYVRVLVVPVDAEHHRPRMAGPYSWIDDEEYEVSFNPEVGNIAVRAEFPDMQLKDLPDPDEHFAVEPTQLDAIRHVVKELGDTHFIIAKAPVNGTFPWVGMEEFLVRMIANPEFVRRASEVYVNRSIAYINAFLETVADAVMTTDDYSDNRGQIMDKARFRELILPRLIRQCEAVHCRGGYFIKHTDGNV